MTNSSTGAQEVIRAAVEGGIEVCFANPGTTEMWFVGALLSVPGIRSVLGLHETVCTGACDGYARMKRKPALCLLHMGPGLVNGLSNLHNARRARSPVVVLVGDVAEWHRSTDPPLCMDIQSLAATVSGSVITSENPTRLRAETEKAIQFSNTYVCNPTQSRVSTYIVPHDYTWNEVTEPQGKSRAQDSAAATAPPTAALESFVADCAKVLTAVSPGNAAIYLGGKAVLEEGRAIQNAGRIAQKVKADLLCENAFARMDRGAGLPHPKRLPYFPQEAQKELSKYQIVVAIDVRLPVAQFGYKDGPSYILLQDEQNVWQIDAGLETPWVLDALAKAVGAEDVNPELDDGNHSSKAQPPTTAKLTAASMCSVIAHFQPEGAIIVDESITSGNAYWEASKTCPRFTHLTLTGGAIGCGPPLAVGAGIACPERLVINIQADGSALYSLQALWTQAKENLRVVTVICSNGTYAILKVEVAKQGVKGIPSAKLSQLTDLSGPKVDWVSLARGMGLQANRATTVKELVSQFTDALNATGPYLIEAVL